LQKGLKSLEDKQIRVVAISYDSVEVLAKFAEKQKITFPLLSDPDSKVIKDYGLLNKEAKGKTEGIPYPGIVLIDKEGLIRAKLFFDGYRERHGPEDIIKAAAGIK
jgi:peroxiredoxin Q/BCP